MDKKRVGNLEELFKTINTNHQIGNTLLPLVDKLIIDFPILLPIDFSKSKSTFKPTDASGIVFESCEFIDSTEFTNNNINFYFIDCDFELIKTNNVNFNGKVRFRMCNFNKMLRLNNTTFNELADFWGSTFSERVIFYKVNFNATTVFSSATFMKNVLFTYTKIKTLLILRGAKVTKGIDLSLAILEGELSIFDFDLNKFKSINGPFIKDDWLKSYDGIVAEIGDIPLKNKRETYRIIKNQLINQKNSFDASKYSYLEQRTYRKEVLYKIFPSIKKQIKENKKNFYAIIKSEKKIISKILNGSYFLLKIIINWFNAISNYLLLSLNRISNRHGTSYIFGVIFTLSVGTLFYYLSILNAGLYEFAWLIDSSIFKENLGSFAQFIIPTHRFDYAARYFANTVETNHYFYLWDVIGRIFVSYGIYQTIKAFRKFR
jgi:hypothetical protein